MSTTTTTARASAPESPPHPSNLGRDAVYAEFRPRDARAIDQGDFVDHPPSPWPLAKVAA